MELGDQVEIIEPGGQIRLVSLPADRGVTNIGADPENDVVLDAPGIPPFYAVLDHRQKPYHITFLDTEDGTLIEGSIPPRGSPVEFCPWEQLECAGYRVILLEGGAPAASPSEAILRPAEAGERAAESAGPLPADARPAAAPVLAGPTAAFAERRDDYILAELATREWTVGVLEPASFDVLLTNGGPLEAKFRVSVEGIDPAWVSVVPPQISLHDRARGSVKVIITAPRQPASIAGPHPMAVTVRSSEYPGRTCQLPGTLVILPYFEYSVAELSPRQQTISWFRRNGETMLTIANKGNSEAAFRVASEDDAKACRFEFRLPGEAAGLIGQGELRLPPGETSQVPIRIMPIKQRAIGLRAPTHSFNVTTTLTESDQVPRTVMGQVKVVPLIGPWLMLLILLGVLALGVWFMRPPSVLALRAKPDRLARPGEAVTLTYEAKRFGSQDLADQATDEGLADIQLATIFNRLNAVFASPVLEYQTKDGQWQPLKATWDTGSLRGQTNHMPTAPGRWEYRLRSANSISSIIPSFQAVSPSQAVLVGEVPARIITFTAVPTTTLFSGDAVTVRWDVLDADSLKLQHDGLEDPFKDAELKSGQRTFTPAADTTYTLVAVNNTSPAAPDKANLTVKVLPRPIPKPEIKMFSVNPPAIFAGQAITLTWEVAGADKLSIKRANQVIGDGLLAKGSLPDQPAQTTFYQLVAIQSGPEGRQSAPASASLSVTVNLPPTPTAVPLAPEIQVFEAVPKEIVAGANQVVKITWVVNGSVQSLEIPELSLTGLKPSDSVSVTLNTTRLFVLTAINGPAKASKALEVKAIAPTPTATPAPTATPQPTPLPLPAISLFRAQGQTESDRVDYDVAATAKNGMPTYTMNIGTNFNLIWQTGNAVTAAIDKIGAQPPSGTAPVFGQVQDAVYNLTVKNAAGAQATGSIRVNVTMVVPPAPTRLSGTTDAKSGNNILTWSYDVTQRSKILGYRVYRSDGAPFQDFRDVKYISDTNTTTFTDDVVPACGRAYFVRGVYLDLKTNSERETASTGVTWYSQLCP